MRRPSNPSLPAHAHGRREKGPTHEPACHSGTLRSRRGLPYKAGQGRPQYRQIRARGSSSFDLASHRPVLASGISQEPGTRLWRWEWIALRPWQRTFGGLRSRRPIRQQVPKSGPLAWLLQHLVKHDPRRQCSEDPERRRAYHQSRVPQSRGQLDRHLNAIWVDQGEREGLRLSDPKQKAPQVICCKR